MEKVFLVKLILVMMIVVFIILFITRLRGAMS